MLLWEVALRSQMGVAISFMEEMWSRNLGNLMISPLRASEFVAALMIMSIVRLAIGMVPVTLLAIWFFGFNLWGLGLALAAFFANLMLTELGGRDLRLGAGACGTGSARRRLPGASCSCSCRSPASTTRSRCCPAWLQTVAWTLPPTYVFEGMRALLIDHTFRADLMIQALALNVVLFSLAVLAFLALLAAARRHGSLMQTGRIIHLLCAASLDRIEPRDLPMLTL